MYIFIIYIQSYRPIYQAKNGTNEVFFFFNGGGGEGSGVKFYGVEPIFLKLI